MWKDHGETCLEHDLLSLSSTSTVYTSMFSGTMNGPYQRGYHQELEALLGYDPGPLPSGKRLHNYGKSSFFMGFFF